MIFRKTYINALRDAMPDLIVDDDLADKILDVVFSVPIRALENREKVELPGLGLLSVGKGHGCLSFSAEGAHLACRAA